MTDTIAPSKISKGYSVTGQVALVGLFVATLTTVQLMAPKLLPIPLPSAVDEPPFVSVAILMPGATLTYTLTFFMSDRYPEPYGRRAAQVMVNVGSTVNFVLPSLV